MAPYEHTWFLGPAMSPVSQSHTQGCTLHNWPWAAYMNWYFRRRRFKEFGLSRLSQLKFSWLRFGLALAGCGWHREGASKIKLKNVNKKRMATARRLIFFKFLKASIADLITPLFSLLQNSEGSGVGDGGGSCADPCQFLPFPKTKI